MAKPPQGGRKPPPEEHRFKKGAPSPCPDGGWARKRQKKREREQKEQRKQNAKAKKLENIVRKIALEEHDVQTSNGPARMSKAEFLVRSIIDRGMRKDATERQMDRALKLLRETGLYDPAPEPGKTGVLVVYPIMEADEWEKATAGELLPKDPLHGIPGAEGLLAEPSAHGRPMPPEEEPP